MRERESVRRDVEWRSAEQRGRSTDGEKRLWSVSFEVRCVLSQLETGGLARLDKISSESHDREERRQNDL